MAKCKFCGFPVASGFVIHSDCLERTAKEIASEVCNYRCKWAVICDDKQKLRERHCPQCGVTKLIKLIKEGDIGG